MACLIKEWWQQALDGTIVRGARRDQCTDCQQVFWVDVQDGKPGTALRFIPALNNEDTWMNLGDPIGCNSNLAGVSITVGPVKITTIKEAE